MMLNVLSTILLSYSLQLILGEMLFCIHLNQRTSFPLRFALTIIPFVIITCDLPFMVVFKFFSLRFLLTFFLSVFLMWFCCDESFGSVLFCCASGFAVREIGNNFYTLIAALFRGRIIESALDPAYYGCFLVAYLICGFFFARRLEHNSVEGLVAYNTLGIALAVLILNSLCGIWLYVYSLPLNPVCPIYACLCGILILCMLFQLSQKSDLEREKKLLEQLLQKEEERYQLSKANAEQLNIKCHDLKHYVSMLKNTASSTERMQLIDDLQKVADDYDNDIHTGNTALDVILMEKIFLSQQAETFFSYMVNGDAVHNIEESDLYALLGNLLDNAIEQESKEDTSHRVIAMRITKQAGMAYIHIENYISTTITFEEDMPITSKPDKENHGFGLKSVHHLVEKYNGAINFRQQGNRFCVDVLLAA